MLGPEEEVVEPEGIFLDADLEFAEVLFADFGEVDFGRAVFLQVDDLLEGDLDEVIGAGGVAAELDGARESALGPAVEVAGDADAIDATEVFAEGFAKSDLQDIDAARSGVAVLVVPVSIAGEEDLDVPFGSMPRWTVKLCWPRMGSSWLKRPDSMRPVAGRLAR